MPSINAPHHSEPHNLPQQLYIKIDEFVLENGSTIHDAIVAFTFRGLLNLKRNNAVVICHPLFESASVEDWWPSMMSTSNSALNPDEYCIICCNLLGSPYGSSSPLTYQPGHKKTQKQYGSAFPETTIRDDVRIHKHVLDILGVRSIYCVIGQGLGSIVAIEWASFGEEYVRSLVLIQSTAMNKSSKDEQDSASLYAQFHRTSYVSNHQLFEGTRRMTTLSKAYHTDRYLAGLSLDLSFNEKFLPVRLSSNALNSISMRSQELSLSGTTERGDKDISFDEDNLCVVSKFSSGVCSDCFYHLIEKIESYKETIYRYSGRPNEDGAISGALKEVSRKLLQPTLIVKVYDDMINDHFFTAELQNSHRLSIHGGQMDKILHSFFDAI